MAKATKPPRTPKRAAAKQRRNEGPVEAATPSSPSPAPLTSKDRERVRRLREQLEKLGPAARVPPGLQEPVKALAKHARLIHGLSPNDRQRLRENEEAAKRSLGPQIDTRGIDRALGREMSSGCRYTPPAAPTVAPNTLATEPVAQSAATLNSAPAPSASTMAELVELAAKELPSETQKQILQVLAKKHVEPGEISRLKATKKLLNDLPIATSQDTLGRVLKWVRDHS